MQNVTGTDRILPVTRWTAVAVIPFLLLAFVILAFLPDETGRYFAWGIKPHLTALYMGSGYLGGAFFFFKVATSPRWHRVAAGFWGVTSFTWFMLLATIVHWDRFAHDNLGFWLWLILYIVTPFLIPALWLANRRADPGTPETPDVVVSPLLRSGMALVGAAFLTLAIFFWLAPDLAVNYWPWTLSPLTARIMGGWFSLLGMGSVAIARESRWSGWRHSFQSIGLWQLVFLIGALFNLADFHSAVPVYLFMVAGALLGMLGLYLAMERRLQQATA
jgi:hypothetical protein